MALHVTFLLGILAPSGGAYKEHKYVMCFKFQMLALLQIFISTSVHLLNIGHAYNIVVGLFFRSKAHSERF